MLFGEVSNIQFTNPPPRDQLFEEGDGFDVYVDGARFLPDNITLSKVSVKLMNPDFDPVQVRYTHP